MEIDQIQHITVVGAGAMGSQIAMVCALAGYKVNLVDVVPEALVQAKASLKGHMENRIKKGRLTSSQVEAAFANLAFQSMVRNGETSQETVDTALLLAKKLGKTPIVLNKEISGFVANRILGALMDEAVSLYESGVASFEDIDTAVTKGLNHPIGPFALMDLTGIDVNYFVRMQRFQETGDETDAPKKSIAVKFEKGDLGRKTGKGWYTY